VVLASAVHAALAACGPLGAPGFVDNALESPIIGGTRSNPGDYPPVGVLLTSGTDGIFGPVASMFCTATLIAPDVVLTAAHCAEVETLVYVGGAQGVTNYFSLALDVRSVEQTVTMPADAILIKQMVKHPGWDISALNTTSGGLVDFKDIAIMILASPINSVTPALVLEADDVGGVRVGANVEIVGYGQRLSDDQTTTGVKYQAVSQIRQIGSSEMQIGSVPTELPQKCHGDSGGPTFLHVDDERAPVLRIIGVTSHAFDDTDCAKGGVDTMVYPYLTWLDQALTAACSGHLRTACEGGGGLPLPVDQPPDGGLIRDAATAADAPGGTDLTSSQSYRDANIDAFVVSNRVDRGDQGCQCQTAIGADRWSGVAVLVPVAILCWRRRARVGRSAA